MKFHVESEFDVKNKQCLQPEGKHIVKQNLETNWILFPQICSKMCCGHNVNIYMRNSCETGKGRLADGSTS